MSAPKEVAVGGIAYFWFAANTTAGSAGDGATPLYDVRLAGAASGAAPTASGTPTLLTHANYSDGLHEIAIDTTAYAAGEYGVFCTLTISSVNPAGFVGSFIVRAAASTLYELVQAILVDTGTTLDGRIPAALVGGRMDSDIGAKTGNVALSAQEKLDVNAQADTALTDYDAPTNTEMVAAFTEIKGATWAAGTDTLELIRDKETDIDAAIAALNNLSAAQVNAEVVDALATDTYAEPVQEIPAATNTIAKKLGYLFKAWRNKSTQTATQYSLMADDAATVDQKATTSDDATTFTKGEVGTGP